MDVKRFITLGPGGGIDHGLVVKVLHVVNLLTQVPVLVPLDLGKNQDLG
jgi:hypothetical protein